MNENENKVCIFHSADLDGHCSGAIVALAYPGIQMHGANYGETFTSDIVRGKDVIMVDFSFPMELMKAIQNTANSFIWIDHHRTAMEEHEKFGLDLPGMRRVGWAACELTWSFIRGDDCDVPEAVRLLGRYDVWDHQDPAVLPFQYRCRMEDTMPTSPEALYFWHHLLSDDPQFLDAGNNVFLELQDVVSEGRLLLEYESQQNAKFCNTYAKETVVHAPKGIIFDPRNGDPAFPYSAIAANRGFCNSKLFDSVYDPAKHDLMVSFVRHAGRTHKWTVSLYSTKPDVDCGAIAKTFGGGGHKGAAGFQCDELPFDF